MAGEWVKSWHRWKNVYFTESNMAQKVDMRDEQMDGGSDGPMCRSKRNTETEETESWAVLRRREMMTLNQLLA